MGEECITQANIYTQYACDLNYCGFISSDGQYTLNLLSLGNITIEAIFNNSQKLQYSPCNNNIVCGKNNNAVAVINDCQYILAKKYDVTVDASYNTAEK